MGSIITKKVFLNAVFCPTYGWISRTADESQPSILDELRMEEGLEIHNKAEELYPDGTLDSVKSWRRWLDREDDIYFRQDNL